MAKPRTKHVQLELPKLDKNGQRRGGKRAGAGRKPTGRPSEKHKKRPELKANEPVHVTLRVAPDLVPLRKRHIYDAVHDAMVGMLRREDFRIVHLSIQHDHIHLLVEADDGDCLASGMQGFASIAARLINAAVTKRTGKERSGPVFPDRYHATIIRSPQQARNAIRYVLGNWRKHGEDRTALARTWLVDPFSSASSFPGWTELDDSPVMWRTPATYEPLPTWKARTWMLGVGWRRAGSISGRDVPAS